MKTSSILKISYRLMEIVLEIKRKVVVAHRALHMFQRVHALVDPILQLPHRFLVKVVELV